MVLLIVVTIGIVFIGFLSELSDSWCDIFGIPTKRWNWTIMWTWIIAGWVIALSHEFGVYEWLSEQTRTR